MAVERCDRCERHIDLDWHVEDIIYCDIKGTLTPVCTDCLESDGELCPECSEYRPEGKCSCIQEVLK